MSGGAHAGALAAKARRDRTQEVSGAHPASRRASLRTIARVRGTPVTVGNLLGVEAPGHPLVALRVGALADDPADDLLFPGDGDLSPCCREDPRALGRTDLPEAVAAEVALPRDVPRLPSCCRYRIASNSTSASRRSMLRIRPRPGSRGSSRPTSRNGVVPHYGLTLRRHTIEQRKLRL